MDLGKSLENQLLFAVPKKGRLNDAVLNLLHGASLHFRRDHRRDIAHVAGLPIALVFLPAADIPTVVGEGRVHLGITGYDQVAEHEAAVPPTETSGCVTVLDLGFGKCKLQVQVPEGGKLERVEDCMGKSIVTSFPNLTRKFFERLGRERSGVVVNGDADGGKKHGEVGETTIRTASGSVEITLCLAGDAAVDLVETGDTMKAAGLKPIATVLSSTAVLITSKRPQSSSAQHSLINLITSRIRGVITAQRYVLVTYNVRRGADLEAACGITPGKRAPTLTSLEEEGWVAVNAMVEAARVAEVMDELMTVGAEDILVTKLENTRTR